MVDIIAYIYVYVLPLIPVVAYFIRDKIQAYPNMYAWIGHHSVKS